MAFSWELDYFFTSFGDILWCDSFLGCDVAYFAMRRENSLFVHT
jgi:hypothetical protein